MTKTVALTGTGISAESGLHTFPVKNGLKSGSKGRLWEEAPHRKYLHTGSLGTQS